MTLLFCLLIFSTLLGPLKASSVGYARRAPTSLNWTPCANAPSGSRLECAKAQVPLDWANSTQGTIDLSVMRLPAKQSQKGYMFYNPGGPGVSGLELVMKQGDLLQSQLGEDWDVVSWDTRGIGESGPDIKLFASDSEYDAFWSRLQGNKTLSSRGNLTQSADAEAFTSQVPTFDNFTISLNEMMVSKNGDKLKHVGTCANVRDLVYLVDATYGEGFDVNFWGISYGTLLGTYLTQMFPERVGRVILDGVYDAEKHSNQAPMKWIDTDDLTIDHGLLMWAQACAATPNCYAARQLSNPTPEKVLALFDQALNTAHAQYNGYVWTVQGQNNQTAYLDKNNFSWDFIASNIRTALYDQKLWQILGETIPVIVSLQHNSKETAQFELKLPFRPQYGILPEYALDMVNIAIYCSDTIDPAGETTEDLFQAFVDAAQKTSKWAGATLAQNMRSHCHRFASRAIERLPQKMNKKPKNVVLVIGNTGDPITPYDSARRVASSEFLGNQSRLIKFNAVGHGSHALNSTCVDNAVKRYVNGEPPSDKGNDEADIVCDVDRTPYGSIPQEWRSSAVLSTRISMVAFVALLFISLWAL